MQKTQVVGKLVLPAFFIPIQIGGVALTCLGLLGLNSRFGMVNFYAFSALASAVTAWVVLGVGAVVAIANGLRLHGAAAKALAQEVLASTDEPGSPSGLYPSDALPLTAPTTLLPSAKNKVTAVIAGVSAVLIFTGLAGVILLSAVADPSPELGLEGFALLLVLIAVTFGLIAGSWIAARVELSADGSIRFRGLFTRRHYANSAIVSVRLNVNGRRKFLVIRSASSFFSVSSYSFSGAQLDLIRKFCDPQCRLSS